MIRRIVLTILISWAIAASTVFSEVISIQAGINVFNDPRGGTASYVEFPFLLKRYQFETTPIEGEGWQRGTISATLYLSDMLGNKIDSASTYFYTKADNLQDASRKDVELHNKLALNIEPGIYEISLKVTDVVSGTTGSFFYGRYVIDPLISDSLCMSDIELAKSIRYVIDSSILATSRLIKNGYEIRTSPMGVFNQADKYIYIYAEIYNLEYSPAKSDSFTLSYQIFKDNGEPYFDFGKMMIYKPDSTAVITNRLDYSSWALGKYELRLTATDLSSGAAAESAKKISIVSLPTQQPDKILVSYRSPLDTASMETKKNWIRFIIDPSDWEMFQTLNDTGKYAFINRHFDDRDSSPGTDRNEYLLDVISRFNYANDTYSSLAGVKNGWNTDRGRILLKYGLSDEIKTASPPAVMKPLQVWYYYSLQGGVYFLFEDSQGYGNFRLVHSTAKGEIYSGGWDEVVNNYDTDFD